MARETIPEHWLLWTYFRPWLLQPELCSVRGERIRIIHPGQSNEGDGPDVLGAEVEIEGVRYRGDVEFHRHLGDWFAHGHQGDQRYRQVILHILWEASEPVPHFGELACAHLALKQQLAIPLEQWQEIMLTLEQDGPGGQGLTPQSPVPDAETLHHLAMERFLRKSQRWLSLTETFSFSDTLWMALAEALGYSHNKEPFRQLMMQNPPSRMFQGVPYSYRSPVAMWVFLAYRAGLLTHTSAVQKNAFSPSLKRIREWQEQFRAMGYTPQLPLTAWRHKRVRPSNHPLVRLAALAQLLYTYPNQQLFRRLLDTARQRLPLAVTLEKWRDTLRIPLSSSLRDALRQLANQQPPRHTMGEKRFRQFIINGLLPLLYGWAAHTDNPGFQEYLQSLFEQFPSAEEGHWLHQLTRHTSPPEMRRLLSRRALYQQGWLEYLQSRNLSLFVSQSC